MRFNLPSALMLLPLMLTMSCSRFLNEEKREEQVIELAGDQFSCLQQWPELIRQFSTGEAEKTRVRPAFQCLGRALSYFGERTRGSMPEAYTDSDLRKFFGKYFLKENNISSELALSFLRLKQAVFGGSDRYITKTELIRVVSLLTPIENEVSQLAPYVRILTAESTEPVTDAQLDEAMDQIRRSMQSLLRQVELPRSDYSFAEAKVLISQIATFARESAPIEVFDQVSRWMPMIESVKEIFFGERASMRGSSEWIDALDSVMDLYDLSLRYHYILRGGLFDTPARMKTTMRFGDKLLSLIENSHQMRATGRLPFIMLDRLLEQVLAVDPATKKNLLDLPLSAPTVKELYRKIVIGMLDPIRRGDARGADSIERIHLVSMRREFNIFRMNQIFVDSTGDRDLSRQQLRDAANKFNAVAAVETLVTDPLEKTALVTAWAKFKSLLIKERAISFDQRGRALIYADPATVVTSWSARSRFNLMHLYTRGFMLGYGNAPEPAKSVCLLPGLIRWYDDFEEFGTEIKAFDPRAINSGERSFREASFFTYSGDGDDQVTMDEMFEFISVLFAAGLENANALRTHLESDQANLLSMQTRGARCSSQDLDLFDLPYLEESCFRPELRKEFSAVFPNMPGLAAYVRRLDDVKWNEFYDSLMGAAKSSYSLPNRLDSSDLRTAVMVLHYLEVLFVTYDVNRDNLLERAELNAAAPRFLPFLTPLSPVKSPKFVTEAFMALVYRGEKPDGWVMTKHGTGAAWSWLRGKEQGQVDRMNILRVFGNLKAELEAGNPPAPSSLKLGQ